MKHTVKIRLLLVIVTLTAQWFSCAAQAQVKLSQEVLELTADNYANGICDMNTYTLALSRRATAYANYLTTLEAYWTTYYHLQTLIQYE